MNRLLSLLLAALGAWALGGCASPSFEREWRAAVAKPTPRGDRFAGAWDGQWTSERHRLPNGTEAGGRLRCLFTKQDATHYRARFLANWLVFASGYEVTFETRQRGDRLAFRGEHDLGVLYGGVYRYQGQVTPERFLAHFQCKWDHGNFDLRRRVATPTPRRLTP